MAKPDTPEAPGTGATPCRTRKRCARCGRTFRCGSNRQKYCRDCRELVALERSRDRRARKRVPRREKERAPRRPPPLLEEKACACGHRFRPASNAQKWCPECRAKVRRAQKAAAMRAWRGKKKGKARV